MTLDDLLEDGTIDEIKVTKNELRTILLDGLDRVNDPDDDLAGISYGLNEAGHPSIGFSFTGWSYDEVEVKLK
jgi:hypothetical protein